MTDRSLTISNVRPSREMWRATRDGGRLRNLRGKARYENWSEASWQRVVTTVARTLEECPSPYEEGPGDKRVCLLVGAVQSGKTSAMACMTAIAADSGYPLIICLTGTKNLLREQTYKRFYEDLQDRRSFTVREVSSAQHHQSEADLATDLSGDIRGYLSENRFAQRAVCLVVLKQTHNLDVLSAVVENLAGELQGRPVLIFDDEADEASLNGAAAANQRRALAHSLTTQPTTTYRKILNLRQKLPRHAYIQVTATPQAPLFIDVCDALSPDYVDVLTPGDGYCGGKKFFGEIEIPESGPFLQGHFNDSVHTCEIPDQEMTLEWIDQDRWPPSLEKAIEYFIIAASVRYVSEDFRSGLDETSTMIVHPHREEVQHDRYKRYCDQIIDSIRSRFADGPRHPDHDELVARLKLIYDELVCSAGISDAQWEKVLEVAQEHVVQRLNPEIMNGATSDRYQQPWEVYWQQEEFRLIIGGMLLGRGLTIEGLLVSYIPVRIGGGQSDTLQQRARWFGYREKYIQLCRVWLSKQYLEQLTLYVGTEKYLHSLIRVANENPEDLGPNFMRRLLMDRRIRNLCRRTVLTSRIRRTNQCWNQLHYAHLVDQGITRSSHNHLKAWVRDNRDRYTTAPGHSWEDDDCWIREVEVEDAVLLATTAHRCYDYESFNPAQFLSHLNDLILEEDKEPLTCDVVFLQRAHKESDRLPARGSRAGSFERHKPVQMFSNVVRTHTEILEALGTDRPKLIFSAINVHVKGADELQLGLFAALYTPQGGFVFSDTIAG